MNTIPTQSPDAVPQLIEPNAPQSVTPTSAPSSSRSDSGLSNTNSRLSNSKPLIVISISPEARVKAASPQGQRALVQQQWSEFSIQIDNAAGITAPLQVSSQQELVDSGDVARERWIRLELVPTGPLGGQPQEERTLRIWSRDAGVRSAILQFDAGQGTQDLGFRSDVLLTFHIQTPPK